MAKRSDERQLKRIFQVDEAKLREMMAASGVQPFSVGKRPTKEAMVERGMRLVSEHQKILFKGHETPGGPVVEKTREEWMELIKSGVGIATYGDIRAAGATMVIDGQLRARALNEPEALVDNYDILTEVIK